MSLDAQSPPALSELLDQQISTLESLLTCLEAERQALGSRDVAALEQATARKTSQLSTADQLEKQRRALVPDEGTMRKLAREPAIGPRWQQLMALTLRCRELNDANGMMIRWQHRRVAGTLHLLRGAPTVDTYGPDGDSSQATKSRTPLASA